MDRKFNDIYELTDFVLEECALMEYSYGDALSIGGFLKTLVIKKYTIGNYIAILDDLLKKYFNERIEVIYMCDIELDEIEEGWLSKLELKGFGCDNNQLTSLPELPKTLKYLYCQRNQLTSLPELPNTLERLYCHHNQLEYLPILPHELKEIVCNYNPGFEKNFDVYGNKI